MSGSFLCERWSPHWPCGTALNRSLVQVCLRSTVWLTWDIDILSRQRHSTAGQIHLRYHAEANGDNTNQSCLPPGHRYRGQDSAAMWQQYLLVSERWPDHARVDYVELYTFWRRPVARRSFCTEHGVAEDTTRYTTQSTTASGRILELPMSRDGRSTVREGIWGNSWGQPSADPDSPTDGWMPLLPILRSLAVPAPVGASVV